MSQRCISPHKGSARGDVKVLISCVSNHIILSPEFVSVWMMISVMHGQSVVRATIFLLVVEKQITDVGSKLSATGVTCINARSSNPS